MPKAPDLAYAIGLPPTEAIRYFEGLGYRLSRNAVQAYNAAQARAFTVTGITRMDILQDVKAGLDKALAKGTTFGTFQDETNELLRRRGWARTASGAQADRATGEVVATLPPRRMQTIFRTNMQSALMAGKYAQLMEDVNIAPYWQYVAVMDNRTRPSHAAMNGRIFRFDDPVWNSHFPPNDFNCRCGVRALRERDIERRDLTVTDSADLLEPTEINVGKETRPAVAFVDPATHTRFVAGPGFGRRPGAQTLNLGEVLGQKIEQVAPEIGAKVMGAMPRLATSLADEYRSWSQAVLAADQPLQTALALRETYRVAGVLSSKTVTTLQNKDYVLKHSAVLIRAATLSRIESTAGRALALALPSLLTQARAVLWDTRDRVLVYVLSVDTGKGSRRTTARVRLAGRDKSARRSELQATQALDLRALTGPRYELIEGALDDKP